MVYAADEETWHLSGHGAQDARLAESPASVEKSRIIRFTLAGGVGPLGMQPLSRYKKRKKSQQQNVDASHGPPP